MSDASTSPFANLVPGFDLLQKLSTGGAATGSVAGFGPWIAPTVSVEELDKRVSELKAVLFWLEQNTAALKATIQALEVQKMTLAALQGMNLGMAEIAKAFTLLPAGGPASPPAAAQHTAASAPPAADAPPAEPPARAKAARKQHASPQPRPPRPSSKSLLNWPIPRSGGTR